MSPYRLLDVPPTDPRVQALMNAQQRELRALYQDTDERTEPFDPMTLTGEGCVLLAAEEEGELVACGALKRWDAESAEVKRMYTVPDARGRGIGRALLEELQARGQAEGYARLVLETGDQQAAALALYERAGFRRIPNFGYYEGIENSLCFALPLKPA
ncbi:GNAT family N-acetyltransferase [Deinococcus sp. HMF7604]|uniref:GNAT family N-acetyltransferase n=1 Tax=Deinococcus betulae TaxID=2873312 RepID=UPI001CCF3703|nr:GNAT family N-acetyltransferase [Deinococcus betulae]MBZ9750006.1 GNAT family N-acetyltransferase [Deinococcus betulae]